MEITLVPYVEINGAWTASDNVVSEIYAELLNDGTADTVFYDGRISDQFEFIEMMKNPTNLPVIVMTGNDISGIAWINSISDNRAFAHFAFFKKVWGKTEELGQKILSYWLAIPKSNGYLLDVIMGLVPAFNERAHKYVERIGFKRLGEIPHLVNVHGNREPGVIFYYAR